MKILIPIEDEIFGEAIAQFIASHEWPNDSEIKLIHVMEPIHANILSGYPSELIKSLNEERQRAARSLLLSIGTQIARRLPRIPLKEEVMEGHAKEVILRLARDWPADLIVMGSHGRSGVGQFLLGSVSLSVLSAVPCSLMVVKLPQESKSAAKATESRLEAVKS